MSWNPFKKAFSSRKPKKDDEDFEYEIQRLRIMQGVCKRLYKGIRQTSEIELALVKHNNKMAYELKTNSSKLEPLKDLVDCVMVCMDDLQVCTRNLYSSLDTTFYDPMRRFRDVYKHLEFHIKQREARLQDVERQQTKLDKRRQSSSVPPSKIEQTKGKLASRKEDYDRVHERLMSEMPKLYEGRVTFFRPCLIAMLQSQYLYHKQSSSKLQQTLATIQDKQPSVSSGSERTVEDCFADIRKLSIVGDSSPS